VSFIAVIPARGGSKRIPRKNLALCGGKPLLAHTLAAARASKALDRIILSTDDKEIAVLGHEYGVEVPFLRPTLLGADATPMIAVLKHLLEWLRAHAELTPPASTPPQPADRAEMRADMGQAARAVVQERHANRPITEKVTAFVLLQPTSPLRHAGHIDEAIALFGENPGCESVLSVVKPPHIFHPLKALRPTAQGLVHFVEGRESAFGRRDLPPAYAVNGPAIVVVKPAAIDRGEMYGRPIVPYVMPAEASIDVDEPLDLAIADFLLGHNA
jgi:CMP-N-acetylneuraminic acid synthetase